jgi:hypothetical protein
MQTRFDKAIRKVDESFNYLKICAEMRETNAQRHSVSGVVAFESLLPDGISLPCGEAPYYDEKDFFGREDVLKQIDSSLDPQSSQGQKFVTIFGLGGVGKSKVTLAYAKKYGFRFDVSLWIKSQTQISLRQSFTGIALELQIPGADQNGKGDENRNVVFDYLKKYCEHNSLFLFHR